MDHCERHLFILMMGLYGSTIGTLWFKWSQYIFSFNAKTFIQIFRLFEWNFLFYRISIEYLFDHFLFDLFSKNSFLEKLFLSSLDKTLFCSVHGFGENRYNWLYVLYSLISPCNMYHSHFSIGSYWLFWWGVTKLEIWRDHGRTSGTGIGRSNPSKSSTWTEINLFKIFLTY